MNRALPVHIALTPIATLTSVGELKEAVTAIAGSEIFRQAGALMNYSYRGEIQNLDFSIPANAVSSAEYPGVYVF